MSSDSSFTVETPLGTEHKAVTFLGGPNSAGPTMGKQNLFAMEFDTVVADTIQQAGSWMVMLYIAGDYGDSLRSPDRWYFDVLNQIERALPQAPRNVNVAVLYDTRRGKVGGESVSQAGATFFGVLKRDETGQIQNLKLLSPSLNTGLPTTLSHFIAWAKDSSLQPGPGQSADHYVLALKGDGAGWQGLCGDEGDNSRLEMGELKTALQTGLGGDTLDLLIFDAPLMAQLEVINQVRGSARFIVASPEMTSAADFDYARLVDTLSKMSSISALNLAKFTVDFMLDKRLGPTGAAPSEFADLFAVWSAIQVDGINALKNSVDVLAQNLRIGVEDRCLRDNVSDNF
ncbi:MAG: clostripain-related cysteine peptidase, partial [Limisphaerales bacterium]